MKAYKIKITLQGSAPLIWRRVIVPAEITFKRLHDIIQLSMGWSNCHLYDFNLVEEKLRITGDEESIAEYEMYSKIKLTKKNDPYGFIANLLEVKPKLSSKVKIDKYLNQDFNIAYIYDLGEYWKHEIALEEKIEDYEYECPMCLEGEGACPPEDIGGICGYTEFLEIINNEKHPEYEETKEWVSNQHYEDVFDIEKINVHLANMFMKKNSRNKKYYGEWIKTS
ncbi:plasmid pRiA4b ORF-3 family protein [Clostridium sp. BL-8]|uniref:plasmid pRiA4b ORF-3 family protein n=1 Tax=Clostridium sp. BL-8 TaxID=349938 RepID=UPI00098C30FF|nr:plasmid pRiA4b ORF-3 family protein [Clostridium sp. BL-8]OOM79894.1 plasmid pRiA4b ORF-3-like protein [Clostridium sp. BL-8]